MRVLFDVCRNRTLLEAYVKTNKNICIEFMLLIVKMLRGIITREVFLRECLEIRCLLVENYLDMKSPAIAAWYSTSTGLFMLQYSESFETELLRCDSSNVESFVDELWIAYIHEDTHRQQHKSISQDVKLKLRSKYVSFVESSPFDLSIEQNLKYFGQTIEADAYGREIAQRLISDYDVLSLESIEHMSPRMRVDTVFKMLKNGAFNSDQYIMSICNVYRDPKMPDDATRHFFRAMYNYLAGEDDEQD